MMVDELLRFKARSNKATMGLLLGFFSVFIALGATEAIFPAEYSVVTVAFVSLLLSPYLLKNFEYDELNVDLEEFKRDDGTIKKDELQEWVGKCLRDGHSPAEIKRSLIENNLQRSIQLLYELGIVDDVHEIYRANTNIFIRHYKTIEFYVCLFVGMFVAFTLIFVLAYPDARAEIFKHQIGLIYGSRGPIGSAGALLAILTNNLAITLICVLLSLLYGTGAIFILSYNASVAAVLYGTFIRNAMAGSTPYSIIQYLPHTSLEIFAYLLAAVSGGLISKAFSQTQPQGKAMMAQDGLKFLAASIAMTIIAAIVEVGALFGAGGSMP